MKRRKNKNKYVSKNNFISKVRGYLKKQKIKTLRRNLGLDSKEQNNSKKQTTRYVSKQKNIEKFRKMSKDNKFKNKIAMKFSAMALACGMLFSSSSMSNDNFNKDNNIIETGYAHSQSIDQTSDIEESNTDQEFDVQEIENTQVEIEKIESEEKETSQEVVLEEEKIEEDELLETQDEESNIKMKDVLIATLNIGFDTEFKMDSGKYYEAPDDTGRYGKYENIDANIKITMVDAIKDGKFVCYKPSSNMTLAEIYADSDSIISIHTETVNGLILGWNSNIDNIEQALIKSELSRIEQNLNKEEKDYIDNIDFNANVNIKNKDMIKHLAKLKHAQNTIKNQEKNIELDEQVR